MTLQRIPPGKSNFCEVSVVCGLCVCVCVYVVGLCGVGEVCPGEEWGKVSLW